MSDQGSDWIWYDWAADNYRPNPVPGTSAMKMAPLPACHFCPNEVKPGEDECWTCLGEREPIDYAEYVISDVGGNTIGYGSYPVAVSYPTTSYSATPITYSATSAVTVNSITIAGSAIPFQSPIVMSNGDTLVITVNGTI